MEREIDLHSKTTVSNAGKAPTMPKIRTSADIAKYIHYEPIFIEGTWDKDSSVNENYADPNNFIVLIGQIKFSHSVDYQSMYDESLDRRVNRIMWVNSTMIQEQLIRATILERVRQKTQIIEEKQKKGEELLEADKINDADFAFKSQLEPNENGVVITPYGALKGTLQDEMVELASFLLSRWGRIVGVSANGDFEIVPTTPTEVQAHMDYNGIFVTDDNEDSVFLAILETTGLWHPQEVKEELKSAGDKTDDGLKNSVQPSNDESSPVAPSKTRNAKKR